MSSVAQIKRILNLLDQLQSGRAIRSTELAQICGVSRRTVFRDFKLLQESGVEILYDSKVQGYWAPGQSNLPPASLDISEALSLIILARITAMGDAAIPFQETVREAAMKLQSNLPSHLSVQAGRLIESFAMRQGPVTDAKVQSRDHYDSLVRAISQERRIRIQYRAPPENRLQWTLLSPYRLFFKKHAWYVVGRSSVHRSVQAILVGRIQKSQMTEEFFQAPPRFTLKRHFGYAWDLNRERNARTQVVVQFAQAVAFDVAMIQWHPTQKVVWNQDGSIDFQVTVDGLNEIAGWILSYGDQSLVLKPLELRKLVASRATRIAAQYQDSKQNGPSSEKPKKSRG